MVRLAGFAAVNDQQANRPAEPVGETVEAQESRLANQYQRALEHVQTRELKAAEVKILEGGRPGLGFKEATLPRLFVSAGGLKAAAFRRASCERLCGIVSFPPAAQTSCSPKSWWPARRN